MGNSVRDTLEIVPEGAAIIRVVGQFGWALYDVTESLEADRPYVEGVHATDLKPAEFLCAFRGYLFAPRLDPGETLHDAFLKHGRTPLLVIENPHDKNRWTRVRVRVNAPNVALFSHVMCRDGDVAVFHQQMESFPVGSLVIMPKERVASNFEECFKVVTYEEARALMELSCHKGKKAH